jgi:integrase/recombinase XerD
MTLQLKENSQHKESLNGKSCASLSVDASQVEKVHQQYIKELKYLKNVTDRTIKLYQDTFKKWIQLVGQEMPSDQNLSQFVIALVESGLSPSGCNHHLRLFNAFLAFLRERNIVPLTFQGKNKIFKLDYLKTEKKKMKVFNEDELKKLLSYRPKLRTEYRLYCLICLVLDLGLRIHEVLNLKISDIDFDNLLIRVYGKGRKERVVAMSIEARKIIHKYISLHREVKYECPLLFCSINGMALDYGDLYREFIRYAERANVDKNSISGMWHSFRRLYARNYLKTGGNLLYLRVSLGHSNLATTQRYIEVEEEDLIITQQKTSILGRLK